MIQQRKTQHNRSRICHTTFYIWFLHAISDFFIGIDQIKLSWVPSKNLNKEASNLIDHLVVCWLNIENLILMLSLLLNIIWVNWTLPPESVDGRWYSTMSTILVSLWLSWRLFGLAYPSTQTMWHQPRP